MSEPGTKEDFEKVIACLALELPERVWNDATQRIRAHVDGLLKERSELLKQLNVSPEWKWPAVLALIKTFQSDAQDYESLTKELDLAKQCIKIAEQSRDELKQKCVNLAQQLNDAATRHLNNQWQEERGKGLLEAAFAVKALTEPK